MGAPLYAVTPGRLGAAAALGLVAALVLGPVLAGLWGTLRIGVGHLPMMGAHGPSLAGLQTFWDTPGVGQALRLTVITGGGAGGVSVLLAFVFCALLHERLGRRGLGRILAPVLALPHAALAIGLAFLIAPSGWIARLIAPLMGWQVPPAVVTVNDPAGVVLFVGLVLKEVPFLMLVMLAALGQIPLRAQIAAACALGYGPAKVWLAVVAPQVWARVRLAVLVALAYALSAVEMALILGPSHPPTLSVLVWRLFSSADARQLIPASAGALMQLGLVLAAFGLVWMAERLVAILGRHWLRRGARAARMGGLTPVAARCMQMIGVLGLALVAGAVMALGVWSLAVRWPWPAALPTGFGTLAWETAARGWGAALGATVFVAAASTVASLALVIVWLEGQERLGAALHGPRAALSDVALCVPLLVPQIGFLFGVTKAGVHLGLTGGYLAVIWGHVLFVFPYVLIALAGPWRARDPRQERAGAALGAGPFRRFLAIRLPILLAPILTAAAIGVAVSVSQYLPTLFLGAGRVATLTTEAVALASGGDRRVTAVYAALQSLVPLGAFALAFLVPVILHRNRRGLRGGGVLA